MRRASTNVSKNADKRILAAVGAAAMAAVAAGRVSAAVISVSTSAPTGADVAQPDFSSPSYINWQDASDNGTSPGGPGQTFTAPSDMTLNSITVKGSGSAGGSIESLTWTLAVGHVASGVTNWDQPYTILNPGGTPETAPASPVLAAGNQGYLTFTLDTPIALTAGQTYAYVLHTSPGGWFQFAKSTEDVYAGGAAFFDQGAQGQTDFPATLDRTFFINGTPGPAPLTLSNSDATWALTGGGDWIATASWTSATPGAVPGANVGGDAATVTFGSSATANSTVNVGQQVSVDSIVFDNATANYTIAGAQVDVLNAVLPEGGAHLKVVSGNHTINSTTVLATTNANPTTVDVAAGATLTNTAMTVNGFGSVNKRGDGTWNASRVYNSSLNVQGGTVNLGTQSGAANNWLYSINLSPGTTLNTGTNNITNNGTYGSGTLVVPTGGTFSTGNSAGYDFFGAITGGGNITIGNLDETIGATNTITWNGALSYTGNTTVTDGSTLVLGTNLTTSPSIDLINGNVRLAPNGGRVIRTPVLNVDASSTVDLTNNKLILAGAANAGSFDTATGLYGGVNGLVQAGRNGGTWDGLGILTSETQADTGLTALAVARASETPYAGGTFAGQSVTADDVLVMYTYGGDADLSGALDSDDYFAIDSNFNLNGSVFGYTKGDFDYNGAIDSDDYFIIDSNWNNQILGQFSGSAGAAESVAAVPEPASLGMIALASAALLARRRRN